VTSGHMESFSCHNGVFAKVKSVGKWFSDHAGVFLLYILFLYGLTFYYLMQWPISAWDNDLWYHLSGGRYILETGSIPATSYFSFIEPPREWVNYYWFFQVIVFKVYSWFWYYGLVYLRALLILVFVTIVYLVLCKNDFRRPSFLQTFLFTLFVLFFLPRCELVRPHLFSYLFIALFLYIFECRQRWIISLPLLALLWTNIHGVEYPVMLLILLAYLMQFGVRLRQEGRAVGRKDLTFIVPVVLSMGAVYVTPHGAALTWVPFVPTDFASLYIIELRNMRTDQFLSLQISNMVISYPTLFNLIFVLGAVSLLRLILRKGLSILQILFFTAGIVLIAKAGRLWYEASLLMLPLLNVGLPRLTLAEKEGGMVQRILSPVIAGAILFVPLYSLVDSFRNLPRYPFSQRGLPQGISMFLKNVDSGGSLMSHPNYGGYLQWMLYPRYRIFMDMEVPFLFADEDFYIAKNVFLDPEFLREFIGRYKPPYLSCSVGGEKMKEMMKQHPQYRIVFFDDVEVLYADVTKYPEVVRRHELKEIDPYRLSSRSYVDGVVKEGRREKLLAELQKLRSIDDTCGMINEAIAVTYLGQGMFKEAMQYADKIIEVYPESSRGYRLRGDLLYALARYDEALMDYRKTLKKSTRPVDAYKDIGMTYLKQQDYRNAYAVLKRVGNLFSDETSYKDTYNMAFAALHAGKREEAVTLVRYGFRKVPLHDDEWGAKYRQLAGKIGMKLEE
jgi:tetratricopeptide (TPR) repeat protein